MRLNKMLKQAAMVLGLALLIISCEDEFGSLGTNIVGEVNFDTEVAQDLKIAAYSRNYADASGFNGVQTSGTQIGVIGFYNDPTYGSTTSSLLSQVSLSRNNPDFGDETVIDSVVFTLPYFSTRGETDADGNSSYTLDSIFGNTPGQMKLSVYRSNFFLNSLDPADNFESASVFFSNEISEFQGIEGDLLFQVRDEDSEGQPTEGFTLDPSEIVLLSPDDDDDDETNTVNRLSPRIRLSYTRQNPDDAAILNYWKETIIDQEGTGVLLNQNTVNDYFRGLYLKAEAIDDRGSAILFDVANLNVTIFYSFTNENTTVDESGEEVTTGTGDISLRSSGVRAIAYENDFSQHPIGAASFNASQDLENGEESLYLKGGDGSIALIDLFGSDEDGNGIADQLEALRSCNIIINEANLQFFVEQDEIGAGGSGMLEPERVFIYDYENNLTLLDAVIDNTTGVGGPVNTRTNHLGRLSREIDGDLSSRGVSYRIRLTQHINNIIKNDSTNVRLALAVSQNVTIDNTALIGGTGNAAEGQRVPFASVISPEGTVLHGSASNNEEKKLRLRLFYTITEEIDPNSPCGIALGL